MSNALKDYAALSDKSPRAWGKEGGFEQRLNKKFEALARQRLAKLGEAGMCACSEMSVQELLGTLRILLWTSQSIIPEKVTHTLFQAKHRPYEREECFSFSNLVLQAQVSILGEDAFLERHWTKLAKSAREADESLRRRDGLPKPAGLAAFQECVELAREASAPVERPRPKSL